MTRIKPHVLFTVKRADEIAECFDVSDELYAFLWHRIVPLQPKREEHACDPVYPLASFWSQVPPHYRKELNALAEEEDRLFARWQSEV